MGADQKALTAQQRDALMQALEARFNSNGARHKGITWEQVRDRLEQNPQKLWSLHEMERTGGEPDVVGLEPESGACVFCDCAEQSPEGRRNLCYDNEALEARKKDKPQGSAMGMAAHMGIELLDEAQYRALQELGAFDTKTSSWVATPPDLRGLGGALFGDRRYERIFVYHNGAQSYYSARGFRGCLRV